MAEVNPEKIVNFDDYCDICKYKDLEEKDDPCFDCLFDPVNVHSHRPTGFKERDSRKK